MLVGMIIPDQKNPFFAECAFHLQIHLAQVGIPLVVLSSDGNIEIERKCIHTLTALEASGIVFASAGDDMTIHEILETLEKPHIILDREVPETRNCDFVINDNTSGIELAVGHLFDRGHRSFGFIKGCQNTDPGRTRLFSFRDAVAKRGLAHENIYEFDGQFDYRSGYEAAEVIVALAVEKRPSAVIASNDLAAIGAIQCFHENGLSVPRDVSVIGFDDIALCQWIFPRLTTVRQEVIELTRLAASFLLSRLSGEYTGKPRLQWVAPRLIERQSTRDIRP
jgi:LacI family transcriptional regulator